MLAPRVHPAAYQDWNRRHQAPEGARWWLKVRAGPSGLRIWRHRFWFPTPIMRLIGEFGFQDNSPTRAFEYAWCHDAAAVRPGMRIIDIGAGASGLPFLLAREGAHVTAVDPLPEVPGSQGWTFSQRDYAKLNRAFGNRVHFIPKFLEDAGLPAASFDRIFCVSVIEHVPPEVVPPLMNEVRRLLKPGGRFVATIDLFTDLTPFTAKASNQWGTNMDVRRLVECSGLRMVLGNPAELHGFPEFSHVNIRRNLDTYLHERGHVMTQCLVLEKP